jgi:NAD+ diphosphatase
MLQTPAGFTPLMLPEVHADPMNFIFHDKRMLVREHDLALPDAAALALLDVSPQRLRPVGMWGTRYAQTAWTDTDFAPPGYEWRGMRSLFGSLEDDFLGVAGRASQLAEWARTHKFCGACGNTTVQTEGERCMTCPHCGHLAYPRISPAMMVLIRKGDAVLLAMHAISPAKRYTPLAGFLEAGESIEEAVHREVMEEVGLRVHNLQYFSSQSWPVSVPTMCGQKKCRTCRCRRCWWIRTGRLAARVSTQQRGALPAWPRCRASAPCVAAGRTRTARRTAQWQP